MNKKLLFILFLIFSSFVSIHAQGPVVTSVTVPTNKTYITGENLNFTIIFDKNVTVNATGGTPQLSLTIGATVRQATYISGSGSKNLFFRYTVQLGELDTDGIAVGTLAANGGTLKGPSSLDANLTLNNVGSTTNVLVDAAAPTVSSVAVPANATYIAGQNLNFTVNFNENITVVGIPQLSLTIGATTRQATYQSGSGTGALLFKYTVQAGELDTDGIAVGTLAANGGTLKDDVGNNAIFTLNSVGNTSAVLVDAVVPTLVSATIENVSPTNVVMVFDEAVTMTNLVSNGFTLSGTTETAFTSISGSGTTWTGVLATAAANGEGITLDYTPGDVADTATPTPNTLVAFSGTSVTNNVAQSDTTAPTLVSATIENVSPTNVVMVFDEAITMTNLVSNGFTLSGTTETAFTSISGSGTTWTGVLATAAANGEGITLDYTPGDVADTATPTPNTLVAFSGTSVTNNVAQSDTTAPTLVSATIENVSPTNVVMVFDEAVTMTNLVSNGFTLSGTTETAFTSISGSGTTWTGVLATAAANGEGITLDYTPGDVADTATPTPNTLVAFSGTSVTNNVAQSDTTAPTLVSATIENVSPTNVVMVFDEAVTMTNLVSNGFTLSGTTETAFTSISGSGTTWTGVLATAAANGEGITLDYTPGDVADTATPTPNTLVAFSGTSVTNNVAQSDTTAPTLVSATIENVSPTNVVMVFDEAVTMTNLVSNGFTLSGTTETAFTSISGSGTTWTGVLATEAANGEGITLDYTPGDVADTATPTPNTLVAFSGTSVTNNVAQSDTTAPTLVSATIENVSPTNVVMVFDEAVTMTNLVSNGFTLSGTTETAFTSISGSGTTWTGVLATAAANGEGITLDYTPGDVADTATPTPNTLVAFSGTSVTNNVAQSDTTAPTLVSATIENVSPTNVVMVFDEAVTMTNLVSNGFTLSGTTETAFTSISGSGTTWTGVLATEAANGEGITLDYTPGDVADTATPTPNTLVAFSGTSVTNNVAQSDTTAPTLVSATIENVSPTNVVMVFDEAVTMTNLVSNGFTLSGTTETAFTSISGSGTTWTGVLATAAANGEGITLDYTPGDVADTATPTPNTLVAFSGTSVTNNVEAPAEAITLITYSSTDQWKPVNVIKTGDILKWTATGLGLTPQTIVIDANDPEFDFSSNDDSDILITVTSTDGFSGLSVMDFGDTYHQVSQGTGTSEMKITALDVTQATELIELSTRYNHLTNLDVSQNTKLKTLNIRGLNQMSAGIDISSNPLLETLFADNTELSTIDVSNNQLLTDVILYNSLLTSEELDQLLIDLDTHGQIGGNLEISGNPENLTYVSNAAYINLINNGWTIDVDAPPIQNVQTITLTTTSKSATWSPTTVTNTGATLKWSVSGGVTIPEDVINDPTFDLSSNTGIATITITSDEGFASVSTLDFWVEDGSNGGLIDNIDISKATSLTSLNMRYNQLSSIDVSQNTGLSYLNVRGKQQLLAGIDISNNAQLTFIWFDDTQLSTIDISNNPLLTDVRLYNADFTSAALDNLVIELDSHGLSNGNLQITGNPGSLTAVAYIAFNNLIDKGWTIDVSAPEIVSVSPKVYLQGPLFSAVDTGLMNDNLRQNGSLPTTSPYGDALTVNTNVFNDGGSSGSGVSSDDIIDWVWVELRDEASSSTIVNSRSALLQRDGDVVALDGVSSLPIDGVNGNYFVAVNHRNHLGIMSLNPIALNVISTPIDLSSGTDSVLGGANAVVEVSTGIFAMYGGDFDGNEQVQNFDLSATVLLLGGSGYSEADFNMNNQIQNTDINNIINPNLGKGQQF